ncbi:MAG TPA: ATP-binding cassette domain-containing protein [Acidothermaceae bacterium]
MNELAIEAVDLVHSYGDHWVLDGIGLAVGRGTVFALLGPNGAGKTTIIRILATVIKADAGRARVAGFDVEGERHDVRKRISLTGQYAALDELQTGRENLVMMGRLRQLDRQTTRAQAAVLLERFDLAEAADRRVGTYSGGMRRRLDLAAGLVTNPEVVFLDEPTTGLDPRGRQEVWDVITGLSDAGTTILLTTQYLEEADRLAHRLAVINHGRIVAEGSADDLKQRVASKRLDLVLVDDTTYLAVAAELGRQVIHMHRPTSTLGVATNGAAPDVRAVLDRVDPSRDRIASFAVHTASLDDVFMTLTGHDLEPTNV